MSKPKTDEAECATIRRGRATVRGYLISRHGDRATIKVGDTEFEGEEIRTTHSGKRP